jgi:hypothetical protein
MGRSFERKRVIADVPGLMFLDVWMLGGEIRATLL